MAERERLIELLCSAPLGSKTFEQQYYKSTITKIADYLLANGVIVPPCKVGDTVYQVDNAGRIYESKIKTVIYDTDGIAFDEKAIGKSIYLTREEAEKALEGKNE